MSSGFLSFFFINHSLSVAYELVVCLLILPIGAKFHLIVLVDCKDYSTILWSMNYSGSTKVPLLFSFNFGQSLL